MISASEHSSFTIPVKANQNVSGRGTNKVVFLELEQRQIEKDSK